MSADPQSTAVAPPAPPRVWPMYRAMVGVGLACGLLIVSVFELTRPVIEANRAEALRHAIFQVLPQASESRSFSFDEAAGFVAAGEDAPTDRPLIHAGYGDDGRLAGLAIEAAGMGYQDVIRVLYGYDPQAQAIVGIRVLESKETPGLGDKIETDPAFVANFERLDVRVADDGATLANPIEFTKHGRKTEAWQVDGITGATISSEAIASLLDRSASIWVPRIRGRLDELGAGGSP